MGMYTGLRFEGIVKKEFREKINQLSNHKKYWDELDDDKFNEFGSLDRCMMIPFGDLSYMPDHWDDDNFNFSYEHEIGYWTFKCSLKNYQNEIEQFIDLVPYFMEKIFHFEYLYEEWEESRLYTLQNDKLVIIRHETYEW